ncbi:hypothetical protein PHMEG_00019094 [Phytophthora megakarya]|uniref:CCHC-type domain-containing protein n=1 Tax=Phytophthora megakarya TaxID=4795 RepID=A0A225VTQ2_9STRA|nr:hypothetical protein PHMEG_00019094 [Phytophthora megakarya]
MESKRTAVNAKPRREQTVSSGEDPDEKPLKKRLKAAVKKTEGPEERGQETSVGQRRVFADGSKCFTCGQEGHWSTQCPNGPKCFACNQYGHLARSCTDVDAKARNKEYLQKREQTRGSAENSKRTSKRRTGDGGERQSGEGAPVSGDSTMETRDTGTPMKTGATMAIAGDGNPSAMKETEDEGRVTRHRALGDVQTVTISDDDTPNEVAGARLVQEASQALETLREVEEEQQQTVNALREVRRRDAVEAMAALTGRRLRHRQRDNAGGKGKSPEPARVSLVTRTTETSNC